jgi:hypothetical protein
MLNWMADFSDLEDSLLYYAVKDEWSQKGKIKWDRVCILFANTGKTRKNLQQRLKTLKRTFGKNLDRFPRRTKRTSVSIPAPHSHPIVEEVFRDIKKSHLRQQAGQMHLNAGEISPQGLSIVMQCVPKLKSTDIFVDIGSGIGNVLVQVSLETSVGLCVGVEVRRDLVQLSRTVLQHYEALYPNMQKVQQFGEDFLQLKATTKSLVSRATVLYSSCELFIPAAQIGLIELISSLPNLHHAISTVKFCPRHSPRCTNPVCSLFALEASVPTQVEWKSTCQTFYIYQKI